jgi:predicted ATPase
LPDGSVATRYAFAHALYQNAFYDELVKKRRTLLHLRVGEQLMLHYGDRAPRIAVQLAASRIQAEFRIYEKELQYTWRRATLIPPLPIAGR